MDRVKITVAFVDGDVYVVRNGWWKRRLCSEEELAANPKEWIRKAFEHANDLIAGKYMGDD